MFIYKEAKMQNDRCLWNAQGVIVCPKNKAPVARSNNNPIEIFENNDQDAPRPVMKIVNPLKNINIESKRF